VRHHLVILGRHRETTAELREASTVAPDVVRLHNGPDADSTKVGAGRVGAPPFG